MLGISFTLRPLPPFSLELTVWALRRRPNNEIDRWDGENYSRIFVPSGRPAKVSVSQEGDLNKPKLNVVVVSQTSDLHTVKSIISLMLKKMFSIRKDIKEFYSVSDGDKRLRPLAERFYGVKPPRFPTVFEALVNAISCQQVSLDLGIILLNRLSNAYGAVFREDNAALHAFPRPEDLAVLSPEDIRKLGFSRNKGLAIIELSRDIINKNVEIESLDKMCDAEIIEYLLKIRGIGRWSAEYALLRGMGRINIFPGDDVGAQRNLKSLLGLDEKPNRAQIEGITSRWQPYAGLVYFHLLLDNLKTKGNLTWKK